MATVPTIDFRPEDFLDGGKLSPQKVADVANRINRVMREALSRGIGAENLRVQTVEIRIATGASVATSFPLPAIALADHMPANPTSIRVLRRVNRTSPTTAFTTASDVDWRTVDERKVLVNYVSGLAVSTDYLLTLLIEG